MKKMKQLPAAEVHHMMLVFIDAVAERTVVILEINGASRIGVLHRSYGLRDSNGACGDLDPWGPQARRCSLELGYRNGGRPCSELPVA